MKNNGSALRGGLMVRLGCGLLALIMLLGLLFAGGVFAYADNADDMPTLSATDTKNGFCVQVKGASVPQDTATLVLKPVSDTVLTYATNGRTLSEDEFFLMYQLCFVDNITGEEQEVNTDLYRIIVYFTAAGERFGSIAVTPVGGTLGELETKAKNKLDAEAAAEAEKAAEEAAAEETAADEAVADTDVATDAAPVEAETETDTAVDTTAAPAEESAPVEDTPAVTALTEDVTPVADAAPVADTEAAPAEADADAEAAEAETETGADAADPAEGEEAAPAEEEKTDRSLAESPLQVGAVYNDGTYAAFDASGLGILKFTGTTYNINDLPATENSAEDTAEPAALYDRLMACETLDEVNAILDNLTEAEEAEMDAFTEEQETALEEKLTAIGFYDINDLAKGDQEEQDKTTAIVSVLPGGTGSAKFDSVDLGNFDWIMTNANGETVSEDITTTTTTSGRFSISSTVTVSVGSSVPTGIYILSTTKNNTTYTIYVYVVDSMEESGTNNDYLSMSNYSSTTQVFWQVAQEEKQKDSDQSKVTSVKLSNINVVHTDQTSANQASGGTTLSTYYPGLKNSGTNTYTKIEITPAEGYYVTKVVIACGGSQTWYNCQTWRNNGARIKTFTSDNLGTVTDTIDSKSFGHNSNADKYCILIYVAPVPTPLRIEYNYGSIGEILGENLSSSVFADPSKWTSASSANVYKPAGDSVNNNEDGDAGIKTNYTQLKYGYGTNRTTDAQKVEAIKTWKHTTNTVTDEAKAAAAAAGYYFVGWKYNYYGQVNVTASKDSYNNNYTYVFSDSAGSGMIDENSSALRLTTNCQLIAQWAPIQLNVTKEVKGLASIVEHKDKEQTYNLTLQKQNANGEFENVQTDVKYTITGDGELTYTFGVGLSGSDKIAQLITPGTYKVVETGNYNITSGSEYAYCTTSYPAKTVTVTVDNSNTVQNLKVFNEYSSTPATAEITVEKQVSGNMLSHNDEFDFSVTGEAHRVDGTEVTSFKLKHGESIKLTVKVGDSITITENRDDSITTTVSTNGAKAVNGNSTTYIVSSDANQKITFYNNKEVTLDTGVSLDSLPYILILGVVAVGAVVIVVNRRKHRRDY